MRFFLAVIILLISYGSLYPFDFQFNAHSGEAFIDMLWTGTITHHSFSDNLGNIALFLPFGLLLAIKKQVEPTSSIPLWFVLGLTLATVLQILQLFIPSRDPSLRDVVWNTAGMLAGFFVGKLGFGSNYLQKTSQPAITIEWLLIGSWLSYQLLPFVPTMDIGLIWDNLKKLRSPHQFSIGPFMMNFTAWLTVGFFIQTALKRTARLTFALVVIATLLVKFILVDVTIQISAYTAGIIASVVWLLGVSRLQPQTIRTVLLVLLLATIITVGLLPFDLTSQIQPFNWIPFYGFLTGSMLINVQNLLEKIFLYASLIWITPAANRNSITVITFLLTTGIEIIQIFSVHHTAEITDPVLVLFIAQAIKYFPLTPKTTPDHRKVERTSPKPTPFRLPIASYKSHPLIGPVLVLLTIPIGLKLLLSLPHIPYNVKELFQSHGAFPRLFLFSLFGIWTALSGPLLSKLGMMFRLHVGQWSALTVLFCALSFFLLKNSVTYESVADILGSIIIKRSIENEHLWGSFGQFLDNFPDAVDTLERYVRYIALTAPLILSVGFWRTFYITVKSPAISRKPLLHQSFALIIFLIIAKVIVIDYAATDNLTELLAEHGLVFLIPLLFIMTGNAVYLGRKQGRTQIRKVSNYLVTLVGIIVGWYLLNLGLVQNLNKYGYTFSGVDFLLGPNRKTLLSSSELLARWGLLYVGVILTLAFGVRLAENIPLFQLKSQLLKSADNHVATRWLETINNQRKRLSLLSLKNIGLGIIVLLGIGLVIFIGQQNDNSVHGASLELPEAAQLPTANLPTFKIQHPRLPAPDSRQIEQIKLNNPDYLGMAKTLGQQGNGKLYHAILSNFIHPNSAQLENLYQQLIHLKFEGRGSVQAAPLAQAYDWLYPYWSNTQKFALQQKLNESCRYLINFIREQRLSPYNVYLYNSPFQALMATAIASYRESSDAQTCMNFTFDLWKHRVLPVWRQIFGKHGGWHEGAEYVGIGIGQAIYRVPAIWRKATGEDLFQSEPGIKGFLDFLIYRARPDGTHMRWGDGRFFDKIVPDRLALAIEYHDKAAYSLNGCPGNYLPTSWPWGPLTSPSMCDPQAKYKLPLNKLFDGIGMTIARSSWNDDATYVTFKAGDNYWSHTHLDQGAFTLYRGGPLAIDSGYYGPDYGSDHHMNYSYQTIAHNVITVTDYNDTVPAPGKNNKPRPIANDGGQRRIGSGWGVESAPLDLNEWLKKKEIYHTGKIEKYYSDSNVVVAIADLTPAYTNEKSGTGTFSARTRRVEDYWRTFIYDRTLDVVVIYDNITATRVDYTKRSIFHTINQPYRVNNKIVSRVLTRKQPEQQGGTLEATVLFPKEAYINIIGGKGAEFFILDKNYDENGTLWSRIAKRKKNPPEPGSWRVEIIPPVAQKTDQFLTVYNPTLPLETKDIRIKPLNTPTQIGCRIQINDNTHDFLFTTAEHDLTIKLNDGIEKKILTLAPADL